MKLQSALGQSDEAHAVVDPPRPQTALAQSEWKKNGQNMIINDIKEERGERGRGREML